MIPVESRKLQGADPMLVCRVVACTAGVVSLALAVIDCGLHFWAVHSTWDKWDNYAPDSLLHRALHVGAALGCASICTGAIATVFGMLCLTQKRCHVLPVLALLLTALALVCLLLVRGLSDTLEDRIVLRDGNGDSKGNLYLTSR
jgi:hypothetical protein